MVRVMLLGLCAVICGPLALLWAQADDDEAHPGLLETWMSGSHTRHRVVSEVYAPPATAGEYVWQGVLLLKAEGEHQFHAFVDGEVQVELGGQAVLTARTTEPQWVSGVPVNLGFGESAFLVKYRAHPAAGGLKLYWSSENFPLEPVPYHQLFHTENDSAARLAEEGQRQLAAYACRRCHEGAEPDLPGPSLKHVGTGTAWAALRTRLTSTEADPQHVRMPLFGLSDTEADAVLAYLARYAEPVNLREPSKVKVNPKETPSGRELIRSLGCLACHEWQGLGQRQVFGGGPLDAVGHRRSRAWLDQWLRDPARLNPQPRMPVFSLSDAERQQIVATLCEQAPFPESNSAPQVTDELVRRGRAVIEQARCAACHELPGPVVRFVPLPAERLPAWRERLRTSASAEGCLARQPHSERYRPAFPGVDPAAVAAALLEPPLAPSLLEMKNCLACHDRNGRRGLSQLAVSLLKLEPQWEGQTPTLVPPPLTGVGDKLRNEALHQAIRGEQKPRLTWLKVRMPRFRHTEQEAQRLAEELIHRDRIPPDAPATPVYPIHSGEEPLDPHILLAGRELAGGKGFSCIACHALKDYVPKQVALGTRGSDLYRLGARMRPEFFFRWTRSPLRIIPGVEMPSYTRPHPTLLEGRLDRQLAALWDALHDPHFTAPTNPAVVEQLWTLQPQDRPRVIRDVFTLTSPTGETETVARSFAVGFPNAHSVLFDLDQAAVCAWTFGDFARQRTQGKSWFWDMAGVTLAGGRRHHDFFPPASSPADGASVVGTRLRSYGLGEDHVRLEYALDYRWSPAEHPTQPELPARTAQVVEVWRAWQDASSAETGWERRIRITAPADSPPFRLPPADFPQQFGAPRIVAATPAHPDRFQPIPPEGLPYGRVTESTEPCWEVVLRYLSPLSKPAASLPPAQPLPVTVETVTTAPGFHAVRLPLPRSIMPTAITWDAQGRLVFTSLKGHVYLAHDTNGDGLEDALTPFAEGLAAPFGILAEGEGLLVTHKPEVLLLRDLDGDDRADDASVVASGWGYTDDYHDWTTGLCRDAQGWYYIGLGSDYTHKHRAPQQRKWRGHILRFNLQGDLEDVASQLRYPVGLTLTEEGRLLCSDQQGVQNCFNELNAIQPGRRYGVPAQDDPPSDTPAEVAAVQIPHPWTRSVNGIACWPRATGHPFAGQIVGAEFNQRALVRCSLQEVDGQLQGAVYPLTKFSESTGPDNFLGPIAVAFHPRGDLYVGSLYDSGWLGGLNVGDIVKLTPDVDALPNGIREVRAIPGGFSIELLRPVDRSRAEQPSAYKIAGYTRVWQGDYATPDSGHHTAEVRAARLSRDGREIQLVVAGLKAGFVYDIALGEIAATPLWPNVAHYTLTRLPAPADP